MQVWGADKIDELTDLVGAAMPDERLTPDELVSCLWDDPGLVLGTDDGAGVVAAVLRGFEGWQVGYVRLVAVRPDARRRGIGRELLEAATAWAFEAGATDVRLAGSAPFYLWPGVDSGALAMHCLAEAAGFEPMGAELDLALATTFRAEPPPGTAVRRVLDEHDVALVRALVDDEWPWWAEEVARAVEHGTCLALVEQREDDERRELHALGMACHAVNRGGWVGPMGTRTSIRGSGGGHALLGTVCEDLMVAGYASAEIAWIGPVRFYAKAGATVSRVFRTYARRRPL